MSRKKVTGTVTSNKMQKTVVVEAERLVKHPRYHKYIRRRKKFYAHCEKLIDMGTKVVIEETRPLSKTKRWRVICVVKK
ncbi:30S ribosomal protein S17 [Patescibacteria group bacterium]|nr:30S ribosomal protein S17 [Patescibacteria group bacterium]